MSLQWITRWSERRRGPARIACIKMKSAVCFLTKRILTCASPHLSFTMCKDAFVSILAATFAQTVKELTDRRERKGYLLEIDDRFEFCTEDRSHRVFQVVVAPLEWCLEVAQLNVLRDCRW